MKEREVQEIGMAATNSTASNEGKGKAANHVLKTEQKSFSGAPAFRQIGHIEKRGEGLAVLFKDAAGAPRVVYLTRQAIRVITAERMPGDVTTITETPQEIITAISGRAFRSRTGRALMLRMPAWYSQDVMVSWAAFQRVMEGTQPAAPVSIVQITTSTPKPRQNSTTALSHGLEGAF
jgi:hypothetical protein